MTEEFKVDQSIIPLAVVNWKDVEYNQAKSLLTITFPVQGAYKVEKLKVHLPVKNGEMEGYRVGDNIKVKTFGLVRLGPKTWRIDPLLTTTGFKAYVILVDVLEPAPWDLTFEEAALKMYYDETAVNAMPHKIGDN